LSLIVEVVVAKRESMTVRDCCWWSTRGLKGGKAHSRGRAGTAVRNHWLSFLFVQGPQASNRTVRGKAYRHWAALQADRRASREESEEEHWLAPLQGLSVPEQVLKPAVQ